MPDRPPRLSSPSSLNDVLLFRLSKLLGVAGGMVIRLCEGRYGITRREWAFIALLAEQDGQQPSQLAERARLDRARTSKTITALVAKGLVERVSRPADRRQAVLRLSPEGRTVYAALYPQVIALNRELLGCLSADEVAGLDSALARLQQQAEAITAQAVLPKANRRQGKPPGKPPNQALRMETDLVLR